MGVVLLAVTGVFLKILDTDSTGEVRPFFGKTKKNSVEAFRKKSGRGCFGFFPWTDGTGMFCRFPKIGKWEGIRRNHESRRTERQMYSFSPVFGCILCFTAVFCGKKERKTAEVREKRKAVSPALSDILKKRNVSRRKFGLDEEKEGLRLVWTMRERCGLLGFCGDLRKAEAVPLPLRILSKI